MCLLNKTNELNRIEDKMNESFYKKKNYQKFWMLNYLKGKQRFKIKYNKNCNNVMSNLEKEKYTYKNTINRTIEKQKPTTTDIDLI